jgi:ferredoxin
MGEPTMSAQPMAIAIDRIGCDGFGMCAELLPEMIDLDDWGYPIVAAGAVPADLVEHARRAAANCPVLALRLLPLARPTATAVASSGRSQ